MKAYMDIEELSEYLGIKKSTLYAKVASKQIPHYKIERLVRFKKDEIDLWMESVKQEPITTDSKVSELFKSLNRKNSDIEGLVKKSIETIKAKKV
jgi:excisionase family DNA binding protein